MRFQRNWNNQVEEIQSTFQGVSGKCMDFLAWLELYLHRIRYQAMKSTFFFLDLFFAYLVLADYISYYILFHRT